jgi:dethiobiotin synthetase
MERRDDHRAMLDARLPAPCLGWLPHQRTADAVDLSRYLFSPFQGAPTSTSGTGRA